MSAAAVSFQQALLCSEHVLPGVLLSQHDSMELQHCIAEVQVLQAAAGCEGSKHFHARLGLEAGPTLSSIDANTAVLCILTCCVFIIAAGCASIWELVV